MFKWLSRNRMRVKWFLLGWLFTFACNYIIGLAFPATMRELLRMQNGIILGIIAIIITTPETEKEI